MATINKTSVRDELDRLKTEFQRQHDTNALTQENRLLIQGLLTLLELIVSIFLEKTTQKNSKNSSKPSSQTEKDESALTSTGSMKWSSFFVPFNRRFYKINPAYYDQLISARNTIDR